MSQTEVSKEILDGFHQFWNKLIPCAYRTITLVPTPCTSKIYPPQTWKHCLAVKSFDLQNYRNYFIYTRESTGTRWFVQGRSLSKSQEECENTDPGRCPSSAQAKYIKRERLFSPSVSCTWLGVN